MHVLNIVLVALAVICASLSVKPSSNTTAAATQIKTEARGVPVYGVVHVVVPNGTKAFPAELVPIP